MRGTTPKRFHCRIETNVEYGAWTALTTYDGGLLVKVLLGHDAGYRRGQAIGRRFAAAVLEASSDDEAPATLPQVIVDAAARADRADDFAIGFVSWTARPDGLHLHGCGAFYVLVIDDDGCRRLFEPHAVGSADGFAGNCSNEMLGPATTSASIRSGCVPWAPGVSVVVITDGQLSLDLERTPPRPDEVARRLDGWFERLGHDRSRTFVLLTA